MNQLDFVIPALADGAPWIMTEDENHRPVIYYNIDEERWGSLKVGQEIYRVDTDPNVDTDNKKVESGIISRIEINAYNVEIYVEYKKEAFADLKSFVQDERYLDYYEVFLFKENAEWYLKSIQEPSESVTTNRLI